MFEEVLTIMRMLWAGETVEFDGSFHRYESVRLEVTPQQSPLEVWLGGQVPAALRRCGRLGEGWMPGLCTPAEAAEARSVIEAEARAAGRSIDGEHFGMNLSWVDGPIPHEVSASIEERRPGFDPAAVVGIGTSGLSERIRAFLDVGFSKFVIRPAAPPDDWAAAVESVSAVVSLQT